LFLDSDVSSPADVGFWWSGGGRGDPNSITTLAPWAPPPPSP